MESPLARIAAYGLAGCLAVLGAGLAKAEEPVRIGFITTLSGPAGYLGEDVSALPRPGSCFSIAVPK